jgi:hypothetical protein
MPPNDTWEEKKIMKYFKSEFVFPKGDSIFIAENFRYLESIADDVKRNEGSFVEFCSTSYTDEDVGLATQRCEYITSQLKLLGLSENEFSISSHCENNYKMNEFQYKGKPHIAGSIEVIYR